MTDEQIISRVRGGETRMFGELVQRHQDPVFGMALRFVGGRADAEDIAQEAFLRAYNGLDAFKGEAMFSTWLYRITFNLCADWLRRNRRAGRRAVAVEEAAEIADGRVNLEHGMLESERRDEIRNCCASGSWVPSHIWSWVNWPEPGPVSEGSARRIACIRFTCWMAERASIWFFLSMPVGAPTMPAIKGEPALAAPAA